MSASSPIRIGLIGAGYIATLHADALKATPGVQITAVCDRSRGAAEGLAAAHGAQVFTSVADLIAARACDAVHILTPPNLHHDLSIECLEGGLDVLVEKPVALSAAETQSIADTAARVGKRFFPGHNFLGLPRYEALKTMVADGQLGRIADADQLVPAAGASPVRPLRAVAVARAEKPAAGTWPPPVFLCGRSVRAASDIGGCHRPARPPARRRDPRPKLAHPCARGRCGRDTDAVHGRNHRRPVRDLARIIRHGTAGLCRRYAGHIARQHRRSGGEPTVEATWRDQGAPARGVAQCRDPDRVAEPSQPVWAELSGHEPRYLWHPGSTLFI